MCFNYGPIFMLPLFSVVFENLEYSRLFDFIETKKKKRISFSKEKINRRWSTWSLHKHTASNSKEKKKKEAVYFDILPKYLRLQIMRNFWANWNTILLGEPQLLGLNLTLVIGNKLWKLYSLSQSFKKSLENSEKEIHQTLCYSLYM